MNQFITSTEITDNIRRQLQKISIHACASFSYSLMPMCSLSLTTHVNGKERSKERQKHAQQVWYTNRCVLSTFFSTFKMERRTDQQTYPPIEMQFYISVMFLGLPDNIQEEKPSFFNFENNWLPTDGPTDRRTDGRTDPLIEMRGRI